MDKITNSPLREISISDKLKVKTSGVNDSHITENGKKSDSPTDHQESDKLNVTAKDKFILDQVDKQKRDDEILDSVIGDPLFGMKYKSPLYSMENIIPMGLTFDDVLLIPQWSDIRSRGEIITKSKFTKNVPLNIPFISSPMDTVTEAAMAIEMARCGGLGILHRFQSIEDQVAQTLRVKRDMTYVIRDPLTIHTNVSIEKLRELAEKYGINTFMVTDETFCTGPVADFGFKHKLLGIVTRRDIRKSKSENQKVKDIMTPRDRLVVLDDHDLNLYAAKDLMIGKTVEKLPVVNEKNEIMGLITLKDINRVEECPLANVDANGKLYVGGAIGANKDYLERAKKIIDAGCDVLVVDIANGHSQVCIEAVERLKEQFKIDVSAGSIATGEGAERLIKAGADGIRCGIGSGSICTTRLVAGSGVPQLAAVFDSAPICIKYGIPLCSDGGNRNSGNMCKALGAGASSIMMGRLIAGCDESPGNVLSKDGKRVKIYRGMAGLGANMAKSERTKTTDPNVVTFSAEGVEGYIPYIGPLREVLQQFNAGIKSGMSYTGARTIPEMPKVAKFLRLTQSAIMESGVHDISKF
jgi:IMP dehydrogenase